MDNMEHGNRIFEIKETVVKYCQEWKDEFENPSLNYYCVTENNGSICCPKCAKKYENKELRVFVDMDNDPKLKLSKIN